MSDMTTAPAHRKPERRDFRWALILIAACALLEVWASWLVIGSETGFPRIGGITTGWILPVSTEAYWLCAGYGWLADPAGLRSRRFAMWSAAGMFALSLIGQESDHLLAFAHRTVPPVIVVMAVTALPLVSLALIAILIHLRHLDRADAAQAEEAARKAELREREAAEADGERTALRAELDAERAALAPLRAELQTARSELARVAAKLVAAEQKIVTLSAQRKRSRTAQDRGRKSAQAEDITTEFRALDELQKDPSLRGPRMGGELARRLGVSPQTGRRLHAKLTAQDRSGEPLSERSDAGSDERSGERP